ncbi:MAG: hypothetical protein UIB39_02935 [Lachnospiraceae bacterium]|nr:hypothetical protein [Lachnospiraceae bacterium]
MRKRRSTALAAALTGAFLLTACGIIKTYPQVNTARFHSDLSLTMISAESMDREYYDLDQLQTVILDAVNDYNEKNPDAISIDYYHVEGELATLILTYQNADHCTAFNEQPVLYGPAAEAWEQGQMDGIGWISADTAMEEAARAETAAAATAAAAEEAAEAGTTAAETAAAEEPAEAGKTDPGTAKPASAEAAGGAGTGAAETAEAAGEAGTGAAQAAEAGASAMDLSSMRFIMLTEPLCVETEDPIAYVSGPVTVTDPHSCVTGEEIDENDPVYILLDTGAAGK